MIQKIGALIFTLGVMSADSDKLWIPMLMVSIGLLLVGISMGRRN